MSETYLSQLISDLGKIGVLPVSNDSQPIPFQNPAPNDSNDSNDSQATTQETVKTNFDTISLNI
jgi:hypothetical protein